MPLDFEEKIDDFATRCGDHIGGYINLSHYDNSADYVSNDDECLFYINTDGFANMGAIYAMFMTIKKEDLKNGNFENAEFNISYD